MVNGIQPLEDPILKFSLAELRTRQLSVLQRLSSAKRVGIDGTLLSLPFVAYNVGTAPRGYKISDAVSSGITELAVTPLMTSAAYMAILAAIPGVGEGIGIALVAGAIVAIPANFIETRLNRAVRRFSDVGRQVSRLQQGWTDSNLSYGLRKNALQDMSGAFGNRRRWLGQEAQMLHR